MNDDDPDSELVEEYAHGCRLVREAVNGDADKYHYEGPMGRVKTFRDPEKAHLYADVQTLTGGFREEKTGERGVPPAVARARDDVLLAYLASTPTMGVEWVARAFELEESEVETHIEIVQNQAEKQRETETMSNDIDDWEEWCGECERSHSNWEEAGSRTVDSHQHGGTAERWECGHCGNTIELLGW